MSNRTSSKQHGHAQSDCQRPKSLLRKKMNKANARVHTIERLTANDANYEKALKWLNSEF